MFTLNVPLVTLRGIVTPDAAVALSGSSWNPKEPLADAADRNRTR